MNTWNLQKEKAEGKDSIGCRFGGSLVCLGQGEILGRLLFGKQMTSVPAPAPLFQATWPSVVHYN